LRPHRDRLSLLCSQQQSRPFHNNNITLYMVKLTL
jgi:hypothetical protein